MHTQKYHFSYFRIVFLMNALLISEFETSISTHTILKHVATEQPPSHRLQCSHTTHHPGRGCTGPWKCNNTLYKDHQNLTNGPQWVLCNHTCPPQIPMLRGEPTQPSGPAFLSSNSTTLHARMMTEALRITLGATGTLSLHRYMFHSLRRGMA